MTFQNATPPELDRSAYACVLVEGASMISVGNLIEPLRMLRDGLGNGALSLTTTNLCTADNPPVFGAAGCHQITIDSLIESLATIKRPKVVFLMAGYEIAASLQPEIRKLLRACKRNGVCIAGFGSATWLMAQMNFFGDKSCSAHWQSAFALKQNYPDLTINNTLYTWDGRVGSCAGESATLDFIVEFIKSWWGADAAQEICNKVLLSAPRQMTSTQPGALGRRLRYLPDSIQFILEEMNWHLETPLRLGDIAQRTQISQRQIERSFARYLNCSPARYYLQLRLERAHQLCEQTELPLVEVSLATGFGSASSLSKHFKKRYGISPSKLRERIAMSDPMKCNQAEPVSGQNTK